MNFFTITTNKETALAIERFFSSVVSQRRSIVLKGIEHHAGFSVVAIEGNNGKLIEPSDIFWMGYFTRFEKEILKEVIV